MATAPPQNGATAHPEASRMLFMSTFLWAIAFAAWILFSIIGVRIQEELGLSEAQFGLLISMPVLTGSITRLLLGIASERFGGRLISALAMLISALSTWLLTTMQSYTGILIAALGLGISGAVFSTGIAFISRWYPVSQHGTVFGLFGVGQIGAAITNFGAPLIMAAMGWQGTARVYAIVLVVVTVIFWVMTKDDPATVARRKSGAKGSSLSEQLKPLRYIRVWRFALYYFFCFGAFVALASWLPRYYTGKYELDIGQAGMLTALFSLSAAVFRAFGGWLSDRWGPRNVMYLSFSASLLCLLFLSYPPTRFVVEGMQGPIEFTIAIPLALFTTITFALGFFMSLGMAAVYKHIPHYFPDNVGSVGGMIGMIGGLGGFFLPILFGMLNDWTGIWTTAFMALFGLVTVNLIWMHVAVLRMEHRLSPELAEHKYLPEAISRARKQPGSTP